MKIHTHSIPTKSWVFHSHFLGPPALQTDRRVKARFCFTTSLRATSTRCCRSVNSCRVNPQEDAQKSFQEGSCNTSFKDSVGLIQTTDMSWQDLVLLPDGTCTMMVFPHHVQVSNSSASFWGGSYKGGKGSALHWGKGASLWILRVENRKWSAPP